MAARFEGALGHLVVSVVDGQVDDDVDLVVGEQVVERGVGPAAVGGRERHGALGIEIRGGDQPDLGVGERVLRVAAGDIAGPDDADAKWGHGREATASGWARERPAATGRDAGRPHTGAGRALS